MVDAVDSAQSADSTSGSASPRQNSRTALTVPLIAAGGALAGVILGGLFSFFATSRQIDANRQVSVDEFLRTQRQAAYTQYLSDLRGLNLLISSSALIDGQYDQSDCPVLATIQDAYARFLTSHHAVILVGSDEAEAAAEAILALYSAEYSQIVCSRGGVNSSAIFVRIEPTSQLSEQTSRLISAAQADLGESD
jgi:hypothetical protein